MAHKVTDECVACGACVDTCPVGAISLEDKAVVDASACVDCGACEGACPTGAITRFQIPCAAFAAQGIF